MRFFTEPRGKSSPRDGFIPAHGAMRKTVRFVSLGEAALKEAK